MQNNAIAKANSSYPEIGRIGDDLKSLKTNVSDLASHVKEDGMNDIAQVAKSEYENIAQLGKKVEKKVKEQPAKSIAIAFAGGVLLSFLLGRR